MKYRPSKSFVLTVLPLGALVVFLGSELLTRLDGLKAGFVPGEITFKTDKPAAYKASRVSTPGWVENGFEKFMSWDHNPWKRRDYGTAGPHEKLMSSTSPMDKARRKELLRLTEAKYQQLLVRYPELAIPLRTVPDENNGFLKWLELSERFSAAGAGENKSIEFSKEIEEYLNKKEPWNSEAAKKWLAENAGILNEIRNIGLMTERSVNGIDANRLWCFPARFARACDQALIIEARVAAEQGNVASALKSVSAAKGLVDHFSQIETPSFLAATVAIVAQLDLENRVLQEILPALPAESVNVADWERAIQPVVREPAEFSRLIKGEWSVCMRGILLPTLLDSEAPSIPKDPGELLDAVSLQFIEAVRRHDGAALKDLSKIHTPPPPDTDHLSRESRVMADLNLGGAEAWRKGWERSQSVTALTLAAFAILKNEPIPVDPVYGQAYQWDPATRQLEAPIGPQFKSMEMKPITVPLLK
jgi:hypothetical protein